MPAYIGNGDAQFFLFIELAGGDDEKVLVEQRSHKTSLFGLADLGGSRTGVYHRNLQVTGQESLRYKHS